MKITISQEGSSPISIDIPERSNEGFFGFSGSKPITAYYSLREDDVSPTEKDYVWCYSNPKRCVRHMFDKKYGLNGVDEKQSTCDWEINLTEHDFTKIIINAKNKDKLNTRVCLYKLEIIPDGKIDKYGVQSKNIIRIVSKEVATIAEFAKKYGIKYIIKDTSSLASKRKKEYTTLNKIVSAVLTKFKTYKGFNVAEREKEDVDKFLSGESNQYTLIDWDAWVGTNGHARDDEAYNTFMKRYTEICNEIKSMISVAGLNGKISDDGDWDDGIIVYYSND